MIRLSNVSLNVVERGAGPPLLLVHGFPLDHSMWKYQLDGLSDICRVIAPDLRGFGKSDGETDVITMEQLADDLAELLDALNVDEPITFCGLSMGGYVAWQFRLRHASRLGRLILCDTRAIADSEEAARGRRLAASAVLSEGVSGFVEGMIPKLFAPQVTRDQPEIVDELRAVMLATRPTTVAAALRGMADRRDMLDVLPQIDVPTLVVCGEHDAISPADEMRAIADAMPNAAFCEVSGAGHMAPLERPELVNGAIRDFLESD